MYEYLTDTEFLKELDAAKVRVHYAKLILLSFDEKPIKEIEGVISAGNISINGNSAIRRTLTLTMLASYENADVMNLDNEISLNKKIKVMIGLKNPLKTYEKYGEIIWFPQGIYLVSSASITRGTTSWSISITGKDKMVNLDGTVGGTLPASVTFSEEYTYEDNGDVTITYPTLYKIVQEAVNHWGNEPIDNIYITDLEETAKLLIKYNGENPIYFNSDYSSLSYSPSDEYIEEFVYGQDIGYKETDFAYPGELILNAGDTVVTLLNKICAVLGNFEFFYDVDGRFIFQEKKNYLNTQSPLLDLQLEDYVIMYSNTRTEYTLTDYETVNQISAAPKYEEIKNDFIVWGKRTLSSGAEVAIRYHLAIDKKPEIDLAAKYMWKITKDKMTLRYEFTTSNTQPKLNSGEKCELFCSPSDEWREELYRQALLYSLDGISYSSYDIELLAEWRNLYDPDKEDWNSTKHWNPDVFNDPRRLNYWLDFIDTGTALGQYSVNMIGRRTKVVNNSELKSIYNTEVPDVIFMTEEQWNNQEKREYYDTIGQKYFRLTDTYSTVFTTSSTGSSCFDEIRNLLYQNLNYNTQITIQCTPKYYFEPNNLIYIEDNLTHIIGNFAITQISLPLAYTGNMSITATEVLRRV